MQLHCFLQNALQQGRTIVFASEDAQMSNNMRRCTNHSTHPGRVVGTYAKQSEPAEMTVYKKSRCAIGDEVQHLQITAAALHSRGALCVPKRLW